MTFQTAKLLAEAGHEKEVRRRDLGYLFELRAIQEPSVARRPDVEIAGAADEALPAALTGGQQGIEELFADSKALEVSCLHFRTARRIAKEDGPLAVRAQLAQALDDARQDHDAVVQRPPDVDDKSIVAVYEVDDARGDACRGHALRLHLFQERQVLRIGDFDVCFGGGHEAHRVAVIEQRSP